jgi:pyruvate carboxylase
MTAFTDCFPTEADEAYVIGKRGQYTPVGAYLAGDEIIKIAVEHGAQLVHPGSFFRVSFPIYASFTY